MVYIPADWAFMGQDPDDVRLAQQEAQGGPMPWEMNDQQLDAVPNSVDPNANLFADDALGAGGPAQPQITPPVPSVTEPAPQGQPQVPGLPPGASSVSGSFSGTGAYQEAPPTSVDPSAGYSAEAEMAPRMAAHQQSAAAANEQYNAAQAQADVDEQIGLERSQIAKEADTQRSIDQARYQQISNQADADVEKARADVKAIDPSRRFKNMNIFQKAAGIIAAGIDGMFSPYHGGKNATIDLLMQLADQDIDAQKTDQQAALENVRSVERGGDRRLNTQQQLMLNRHYQRGERLEAVADHFAAEAAKAKSQFNAAHLLQQNAAIMEKAASEYVEAKRNVRDHNFEQQKHADQIEQQAANRRQQAAQFAKSYALQKDEADARKAAAAAGASNLRLTRETGLETVTGGKKAPGWVATNEKEREEVGQKTTEANTRWVNIDKMDKLLDDWGRLNLPSGEVRNRLAAMSARLTIADLKPGMGSEADAKKLTAQYGGDFDTFVRSAPPEVLKKVFADTKESTLQTMKDYTGKLSRQEGTSITWTPPEIPAEVEDKGPALGDPVLQAKGALQKQSAVATPYEAPIAGKQPAVPAAVPTGESRTVVALPEQYREATQGLLEQLKTFKNMGQTESGRKTLDSYIETYASIPEEMRKVMVNRQEVDPLYELLRMREQGVVQEKGNEKAREMKQRDPGLNLYDPNFN